MKNTWHFVLKIIGLSLALAGLICLVVGCWDALTTGTAELKKCVAGKCRGTCSEFDDYDDNLLYKE